MLNKWLFILAIVFSTTLSAQKDIDLKVEDSVAVAKIDYNPLAPSKAAFYSAIVPGLGQAYNKKYWKIPVVYALLGGGVYFYVRNDNQYDRYRTAYKNRLAGLPDEFTDSNGTQLLSDNALIDAQRFYSRNKELSLLVTVAFYLLNIIDANVDAHLMQFNVNSDLSVAPDVKINEFNNTNVGLTFNYRF